jgi:hypothetical protein
VNHIAHTEPAAMMRTPPRSSLAARDTSTAERPGGEPARAQTCESQPGQTGNPGATVDPHSRDGGLSRSGGGTDRRTVEEHVAHGRKNPEVAKLYAFYAAGAGFRDGRPVEHCPYDQPGEEQLRDTWFWFYRVQAEAARKARPATPPAEFRQKPRRVHHSKRVVTTSAAYAEQLGVEPAEGEQ